MADTESSGRKWLTCGCIGCLSVLALVLLVAGLTFGRAWLGVRGAEVEEKTFAPPVPAGRAVDRETEGKPGRVVLRATSGEFHLRPAEPGESLHVEAKYDQRSFDLQERFDPGGEHWTYEIDFERKGSMLMGLLKSLIGGASSRLYVYLPADVPLALEVDISQGGGDMDLGGLWLTSGEIVFRQGGFELDVSRPMREPMESLVIRGSMGGFTANRLGDASPRRLDVECSMGGMELDLRGNWVVDSAIGIRVRQGGGSVQLPRGVEIVGLDTRGIGLHRAEETPRPTLTFSVSSSQGELEIIE